MKRDELKSIFPEATDDQINAVMKLNGADIEREKSRAESAKTELVEKAEAFEKIKTELDALKESNASAEDWRSKFETLKTEVAEKERAALEAKNEKERLDRVTARFATVANGKKWRHPAVREKYLQSFSEALKAEENVGRSDGDIFHDLTKDDREAFENVTAVKLEGNHVNTFGKRYNSADEIMAIKDGHERRKAMAENFDLFKKE